MIAHRISVGRMVSLKGFKELKENFVLGLFASNHIRVLRSVVCALDICNINETTLVLVENVEGFHGDAGSRLVH